MTASAVADRIMKQRGNEANLRQNIGELLGQLGVDEFILEYRVGSGWADLYLPRHRIIIETKAPASGGHLYSNSATQKGFEQLDQYVKTEIDSIRSSLFANEKPQQKWLGILTNGAEWKSWSYAHRNNPVAQPETSSFTPSNGKQLVDWLTSQIANVYLVGKPWVPSNPIEAFGAKATALSEIYIDLSANVRNETNTKLALWRDMLRSAGMEPSSAAAQDRLFVTHSFLIALARGVIATLENPDSSPEPDKLLSDGFVSWILQTTKGRQWASEILGQIFAFDWRQRQGDVLRPLYEAFVSKEDRKDFGEVYTPDWLAEMLVEQVLDADWCNSAIEYAEQIVAKSTKSSRGVGILDPCCGSGTFLYHAVRRLSAFAANSARGKGKIADIVTQLVYGIDIHPVACEFARATILRALPAQPSDDALALQVYNGDALLLKSETEDPLFAFRNGEYVLRSPKGNKMALPSTFVARPDFPSLVHAMTEAAIENAELPNRIANLVTPEEKQDLLESQMNLNRIVAEEGNSVWAWFICQSVGPFLLSQKKVDRIISNPPWVKMATIQHEERKRSLKDLAKKVEVWVGGKQAPHADIAQLFLTHCRDLFLQSPKTDIAAWVVKSSAIQSGQWDRLRDFRKNFDLKQTLNFEKVQVFGGGDARKACVLLDNFQSSFLAGEKHHQLDAECKGSRPNAGSTWNEAKAMMEWQGKIKLFTDKGSDYVDFFRQGATVVPHVLLLIDEMLPDSGDTYRVKTRRSKQTPWSAINAQELVVPSKWLLPIMRSEHLLPFCRVDGDYAVVPVDEKGALLDGKKIDHSAWWFLESVYDEYRGKGTSTPRDLLSQINYRRKAECQLPLERWDNDAIMNCVIYPGSGDVMRACRSQARKSVLDSSLYYSTFETADEAAYLVSILNAPCLMKAFVAARRSGRDFQTHHWLRIGIPKFSPTQSDHAELVDLCHEAEQLVAIKFLGHSKTEFCSIRSQVGKSNRIRNHLTEVGFYSRLNEAVSKILAPWSSDSVN
ncbi:MAG: N-6 DNA methylase [Aestuariivita sp.]|nr:N-6 DNA methylase [Aestuariivita sp.]MCY4347897.1 N-6 DNA methylase [Aestuariivita sp.]